MHVPVELRARVERRVDAREEVAAYGWSSVFVCCVVERVGEGYFVEVQGECVEVEVFGEWLDVLDEGFGPREGEGVVHCGRARRGGC